MLLDEEVWPTKFKIISFEPSNLKKFCKIVFLEEKLTNIFFKKH